MWLGTAAINLALAVMLGAFGAHGLKQMASAQQLEWWHTATQYFFWHALGLLMLGVLARTVPAFAVKTPFWLLQLGLIIFCGSLYLMALGLPRWLGAITPVGGVTMIIGWLTLAWMAFKQS
ncbi:MULTISPECIES: DUF423 domain-containing protein [Snodgrassella]|uniref:DUF423 domain-containing protein n=1 Tax=Snodgrassella alvi TaxID=1196083 RepID=A0A2N9X568_9NEIS|nr:MULTISPECIES: DUF423 domain-containing protein [Snodgrassella]MCT6881090.1 DUF423 domain-containing protein [Snodgrassella alvi]MCX8746377.1 DUF423 domain-containing protein [Snodgrassella sp. B3800]MCX8753822.1 DUF423 domain-containing protein [Snodgrassella sp. B3837]PIT38321.1 hypothetical protein BHC54_07155 [Snodgrassella alvi]PIT42598.1 hypothetical protein BHC53_01175 [Snodgrassella alvi]